MAKKYRQEIIQTIFLGFRGMGMYTLSYMAKVWGTAVFAVPHT